MLMYRLTKRLEISAAHRLNLPYPSRCTEVHGHNFIVEVTCESDTLNEQGMVVDFSHIREAVMVYDHKYLNDFFEQPTAENLARAICEKVPYCVSVKVQESENNVAEYIK
jgi:6-pyruvoyltetrahydropterin/6-carboxytetrahydropterin synthase